MGVLVCARMRRRRLIADEFVQARLYLGKISEEEEIEISLSLSTAETFPEISYGGMSPFHREEKSALYRAPRYGVAIRKVRATR